VTTTAPPGLRERKKERTRQALEDAALDLFARQGFDHTTVDEIAAACDVSTRTFFRYFPTKEDALLGDKPEQFARVVAALEARPAAEAPLRSVRAALVPLVDEYARDRPRMRLRSRIIAETPSLRLHDPEARQAKEQVLVDALARRDAAAGIGPRLLELRVAVGVSGAAFRAALDTWLAEGGAGDLRATVAAAFDQVAAGLDGGD
jgi:AcrR family transcriptional regulator